MKFLSLALAILLSLSISARPQNRLQTLMVNKLTEIGNTFSGFYAPASWKKERFNWMPEIIISDLKTKVLENPDITIKEYHKLLRDFFNSTKDYHVAVWFNTTEESTLPFTIRGAEGRFFIVATKSDFRFSVGDELILFGGKKVQTVVDQIKLETGNENSPLTDQALAELYLTKRRSSRGMSVPRGKIKLTFKKNSEEKEIETYQLAWTYTEEEIDYKKFAQGFELEVDDSNIIRRFESEKFTTDITDKIKNLKMFAPLALDFAGAKSAYSIGEKKSFIPDLGEKKWETTEKNPFNAYIYENDAGKRIGYIRIGSYSVKENKFAAAFEKIIVHLQGDTDGLVIDQVNNPGGSVFYLYNLVSMLTNTTMKTPLHHMVITDTEVMEAYKILKMLKNVGSDKDAQKLFGKTVSSYPVDLTFISLVKDYYQFIIAEFNRGKTLTDAYHIWGVEEINPHKNTKARYTKPILLLVNELDFSGGDFFPAIMQDNERATILGTKTAGAGGYVLTSSAPNFLGIGGHTYTGSIAKRVSDEVDNEVDNEVDGEVDGEPLENLGVSPKKENIYNLTAKDYQDKYSGYLTKIKATIDKLVE